MVGKRVLVQLSDMCLFGSLRELLMRETKDLVYGIHSQKNQVRTSKFVG